ncbi:MAG TPA: hypothetical protein VJN18_07200 [Polyangiaceae bacterium]|nr:hypothetical protein [Polyangiaceae bacterium]
MTQDVKKLPISSTTGLAFAALMLLGLGAVLTSAGCDSDSDCQGDECKAPCRDSDCAEGQRCVQNECRDSCTTDSDCPGVQVCSGFRFASGEEGRYCVILPGTVIPDAGDPIPGRFSPCESHAECDEAHGFSCMGGQCNYPCRSHADCVEVGHCDSRVVDGQRESYCVRDEEPAQPGALYTACPDGDECLDSTLCLSAGPGDLDAYCTIDCSTDGDCLPGYYCGSLRRPPCEDMCGFQGQPENPRCVPTDQIGEGLPYQCSELGITRSVCRQRDFCTSCQSDADCLAVPNQICARDASGNKICTRLCDPGAKSCPWGNAAECDLFDTELGEATCSHRYGACRGNGAVCEPCTIDADCPSGVCYGQQFTGERWCINFDTRCECPNGPDATGTCDDGGCPESPGGVTVLCIGEPASDLFNTCYTGNSSGTGSLLNDSPQTGCWAPN